MIDLSEYKDGDRATVTITGTLGGVTNAGYLTMKDENGTAVSLCNLANVADSIKRAAPKWQEGDVIRLEHAMQQEETYIRDASGDYPWRNTYGEACYSDNNINEWLAKTALWYIHDGQYVDLRK